MSDDDDRPHGMAFPIDPTALFEAITGARKQHERAHMEAERRSMTVDNFFDSLSAEQLLALRYILNAGKPNRMSQFFDGQAYALLRWKHGVDPDSGVDPLKALVDAAMKADEDDPAPAAAKTESDDTADTGDAGEADGSDD